MDRKKKYADEHVDSLLKKLYPKEFESRAYHIARLYYYVGDYSSCMKYVVEYLTQNEKDAGAYELLGQALLELGQKDKALDNFITSIEIHPTQTSLILDICELLADHQVEIDVPQATYWCDKAQGVFPRHQATFRLCERLVGLNNANPEAVVELLKTQLKENPRDAFLHARLLKHYLNTNKIKEAFEHGYNVEFVSNAFNNNIAWYESLIGILKQNTHNIKEWNFQLFLLTVRERICYLSITETPNGTSKSIVESNELLNTYDQAIDSVAKAGSPSGFGEFHLGLIQHHKGQLAFHIATYLLKKAKKEQLNWRDATRLAAPFFLISWQTVPLDPKVNWLSHAPEKQKDAALRWYLEGSYRCSQSGHYLISNLKDKSQSFLDNIAQLCSDTNWRDKLYGKIFTSKDHLALSKSSYLVSKSFNPPILRLPRNQYWFTPGTGGETSTTNKLNVFDNLSFKTNSNSQSLFSNLLNKSTQQESTPAAVNAKLNTSDTVEEFEPTADFKPVVPLPALIDQKTGEEDEKVLFEHRAKLLRFDNATKEWKERGLGNIKLLMQKENAQKIRLLMRREQIMKVCCNHVVTKDMTFQKMPNMDKAVTWCAKDFSEGELVAETFCLRFKTVQACEGFIDAIKLAQSKLKDESKTEKEVKNAAEQSNQTGFGDKFKPKIGSWYCDSCYTNNLESFLKCACCEQPKSKQDHVENNTATPTTGWGDKFKPKAGSWECQQCFIRNDSTLIICSACSSAKDPSNAKAQYSATSDNSPKFNFGIPTQTNTQSSSTPTTNTVSSSSWGDKFKPKEGSWECKECFVRNEGSLLKCSACSSPKDPNSKANSGTIFAPTQGKPFSFGIPSNSMVNDKPSTIVKPSIFDGTGAQTFSFGIAQNTQDKTSSAPLTSSIFASTITTNTETPLNFSLNKDNANKITPKPALLSTPTCTTSKDTAGDPNSSFGFVFKPKTPPKSKSPGKSHQSPKEDDSDGYVSEDEGHHIHFNPIIPLPDKVAVITGEENENELYGHRAKLFIFTSGEWKERGIRVVKILKHKETGKLRVVMRREQVLKICLNHSLTEEIAYTPKDDKTWLFAANDFSEGELNLQQFCLRFKTKEIAEEFKQAVDIARGKTAVDEKREKDNEEDSSDNDVVFIGETQASAEDKKKAKDLMLPENFYTYKDKDPCQGCRGCNNEVDETMSVKPLQMFKKELSTATSTPVRLTPTVLSQASSAMGTPSSADKTFMGDTSIYRTPLGSTMGFLNTKQSSPSNNSIISSSSDTTNKENNAFPKTNLFQSAPKSVFDSPASSIFPQTINSSNTSVGETKNTESKTIFSSFTQKTTDGPKNTVATSVFGNFTQKTTEEAKSIDPKSVFGSFTQKPTEEANSGDAKSLFGSFTQTPLTGSLLGSNNIGMKKPFTFSADTNKNVEKSELVFGSESQQSKNLFGTLAQGSIFGLGVKSNAPEKSIFGASQFGVVSTQSTDNAKTNSKVELKEGKEPLFKIDKDLSFSALASLESSFQKNEDFKWEGEGEQLFGTMKKPGADDSGPAGEEEYDPHYEPIVPLPDKIVVTTGEEDEEKIYGERCKLYRFDEKNTEWKERGVGELKILYHPEKKTYRLLLRREQVSDLTCSWSGTDFTSGDAREVAVTVTLPDADTAMTLYDSCETSKAATYSSTDPES